MHRSALILSVFLVCSLSVFAKAQTPPVPAPPPAKPMTLQQALTQLSPVPAGITLTVGPQWENLPTGQTPPKPSSSPSAIAQLFGKAKRRFGRVDAIAPPTMVLLGEPAGDPNPYLGMAYYDLIPLFADSLSEAQWASLTSEQGLGIASLSQTQQQMFAQLLPDGQLKVEPWRDNYTPNPEGSERDLTDELMSTHLRIKQTIQFMIPPKGQDSGGYDINTPPPSSSAPVYQLLPAKNNWGNLADVDYGQQVRAEVPNAPKHGQLDLKLPVLQTVIPVNGLKTVGDLMARIGQATHMELYADRRLEQKTLMILGTGPSAPASDLLQAIAFCLTSTYRQVGPAYVLTDDVVGIATRMVRWHEFEKYADALRQKPLEEARDRLYKRYGQKPLPAFGDLTAMTADQQKERGPFEQPLSKLTAEQQKVVQQIADRWDQEVKDGGNGGQPLNLDGKIMLQPSVALQLIVPSLQAPVDMNVQIGRVGLFSPPPPTPEERKAQDEKSVQDFLNTPEAVTEILAHPEAWGFLSSQYPELAAQFLAAHPDIAAAVHTPKVVMPKLTDLMKRIPNRAAMVAPQDAATAAADVTAAQAMGLTQLWVTVFADGKTDLAPLTAALKRAKGTPLQVFAVLNVFSWGAKSPSQDTDLTVLGETSVQAETRHQERLALQGPHLYDDDQNIDQVSGVAVNPLAADVQQTLLAVVRSLKGIPGLTGVVFRETAPPGYDLRGARPDNTSALLLGYQENMRLAFLRAHHADPIDVFSDYGYIKANTDLPNFQNDGTISEKVSTEWDQYRHDANLSLLRELRAATLPRRVVVKLRGIGSQRFEDADGHINHGPGLYSSWDNPKALPPMLYSYRDDASKQPLANQDPLTQAKSQSPLVFTTVTPDQILTSTAATMSLAMNWKENPPPGYVIDMGDKLLAPIAASLAKHSP